MAADPVPPVSAVDGQNVVTIEGLGQGGKRGTDGQRVRCYSNSGTSFGLLFAVIRLIMTRQKDHAR